MPIEITQAPIIPAVTLNRVHAVELRINITEEQTPKAPVRLVYKLYGHDAEGQRRWAPEQQVIMVSDAYTQAAAEAQQGNPALYNALVALEEAIAALVAATGKYGAATRV